jgi:hypothetical protein
MARLDLHILCLGNDKDCQRVLNEFGSYRYEVGLNIRCHEGLRSQ